MVRIVVNPTMTSGEWAIEGTRILAITVASAIFAGQSEAEIHTDHPSLPPGTVGAVAAWMRGEGRDFNRELIRNNAKCLLCGDEIESKHRHDLKYCSCGNIAVDGGAGRSGNWRRLGGVDEDPGVTWVDTSIFVGDQE